MGAIYDFSVDQGATRRLGMVFKYQSGLDGNGDPVYTAYSLTGCTARMQVRTKHNEPVLIELTTENGGIEIQAGSVQGRVDLVMTAAQTALLEQRRAVYDLELVWPSGDVTRLLQGKVTISPNVTEPQ